jgi:hypothetical protein
MEEAGVSDPFRIVLAPDTARFCKALWLTKGPSSVKRRAELHHIDISGQQRGFA